VLCDIKDMVVFHMSAPLTRQYDLRVGKGEWGPTLPHTTVAYASPNLSVVITNYNYFQSQYLGIGVMFSRGGFTTKVSQAGPSEKTLWSVSLYDYKAVKHAPGASYETPKRMPYEDVHS
jgi:hypothetical protein